MGRAIHYVTVGNIAYPAVYMTQAMITEMMEQELLFKVAYYRRNRTA